VLARQIFYHLSHSPAVFAMIIFGIGSPFMPRPVSCVTRMMTGVCHHPELVC
jgi:hypothetical protein